MNLLKKIWHDPVLSTVIAAVILTPATYFSPWWPAIKGFFFHVVGFLISNSQLPNWLIGLFIAATVFVAIVALVLIWEFISPKPDAKDWHLYRDDIFLGIRWRWNYSYSTARPVDLYACCAKCDFQFEPQTISGYTGQCVIFKCDNDDCMAEPVRIQGRYDELESKVIRSIQKNIRSWQLGILSDDN